MSRIGKKKIMLTDVKLQFSNNVVTVQGKKGVLTLKLPSEVNLIMEDDGVLVNISGVSSEQDRLQGLYRTLIQNMVNGVVTGFQKDIEVVGIGYRIQLRGSDAVFALGYSHEIEVKPPDGIEFKLEGQNKLSIIGIDKELVGQIAANIRKLRVPDAYKGKGVRYVGEVIKTKQGKSVKK
ncbi:MAG: 50S ribosomal protein L6 [Candidatus Margulisiibacteriota bacterium]|jgi:large subunit ribosomal protein L6